MSDTGRSTILLAVPSGRMLGVGGRDFMSVSSISTLALSSLDSSLSADTVLRLVPFLVVVADLLAPPPG